jgi:hypothetical protein
MPLRRFSAREYEQQQVTDPIADLVVELAAGVARGGPSGDGTVEQIEHEAQHSGHRHEKQEARHERRRANRNRAGQGDGDRQQGQRVRPDTSTDTELDERLDGAEGRGFQAVQVHRHPGDLPCRDSRPGAGTA